MPRLFTLFFVVTLSACGFQLRSNGDLAIDQVYVDDLIEIQQAVDQPLSAQLISDLEAFTSVSYSPVSAPGILILNEEYIERSLSLSANLFNRQIELEKRVYYRIVDSKGEILAESSIFASRELTEDQANPSAKQQERKILIDAINSDISRQLIRILANTLEDEA